MKEKLYNQLTPANQEKWNRSMAGIIGRLGSQGILEAVDIDSNGNFITERLSQKEFFRNEANQALLHNLERYKLKTGKLLEQARRTQSIGPVNPVKVAVTPILRVVAGGKEYAQIKNGCLAPPSQPMPEIPPRPVPIEHLQFIKASQKPISPEQDPLQPKLKRLKPPSLPKRWKDAVLGFTTAASMFFGLGINRPEAAFAAPFRSASFSNPTSEQPSSGEIKLVSQDTFFQTLKQLKLSSDVEHAMTVLATPHGREANPEQALRSGYDTEAGSVLLEACKMLRSMLGGVSLTAENLTKFIGNYNSHKEAFGNTGISQTEMINQVGLRMQEDFQTQARNALEIPSVSQANFSSWLKGMRLGPETTKVAQALASEGGRFNGKSAAFIQELIARYADRANPTKLEENPNLLVQIMGANNSFTKTFPNDLPSKIVEQAVATVTHTSVNSTESGPKPVTDFEKFERGAIRPSTVLDVQTKLEEYGYNKSAQESILEAIYDPNPDSNTYVGSEGSQLSEVLIIASRNGVILDSDQTMVIIGAIKENSRNLKNGRYIPFYRFIENVLERFSAYGLISPENRSS